ncbi:MAG: FprA family A-type flavoprotein [Christensenellales bacterium]|jgi:flavorubredoxin
MKKIQSARLADGIEYVGAVDKGLRTFDVVMHTPYGTTYNAFIIRGSEKTALIDVVKDSFASAYLEAVQNRAVWADIDYIVLQHAEPDHSGALPQVLELATNATVVCSRAASVFLKGIVNRAFRVQVAGDGDEISLGGKTLKFALTPFLHWPDTMCTYVPEDRVLFSCDIFGCHYAIEESVWAQDYPQNDLDSARRYYFDMIMQPFKKHMPLAVQRARAFSPRILAPGHGPILRAEQIDYVIDLNDEWSRPYAHKDGKKHVFIGYVSAYGYTRALAMRIREAVEAKGQAADTFDVSVDFERAVRAAGRADVILLGSPTINRDALPPIWELTMKLSAITMQGRPAAVFGSFGWSGEAVPMLEKRLESLGMKLIAPGLRVKFRPTGADLEAASLLGVKAVEALEA